jgi:hypothetical protein
MARMQKKMSRDGGVKGGGKGDFKLVSVDNISGLLC